jgi:hypothetical protein
VLPKTKSGFVVHSVSKRNRRTITAVNAGYSIFGAALPRVCHNDPATNLAGVIKRMAVKTPDPDPIVLGEFRAFVGRWLLKNLVPVSQQEVLSFDEWLAGTNYSNSRAAQLRLCRESVECGKIDVHSKRSRMCKSFIKMESYPEYKHSRSINSRPDCIKVIVGPYFKTVEKILFSRPEFIKKIPVEDRPVYIMNKLCTLGATYVGSDYTSFESCFTQKIMEACELPLYEHLLRGVVDPIVGDVPQYLRKLLVGKNTCHFTNGMKITVPATRMSGEMNTSLGNGFTNLMLMLFVSEKHTLNLVDLVIEGDDCLAAFIGRVPTFKMFEQIGFVIKIDCFNRISDASFCGLLFDEDDLDVIANPIKVLLNLCWFHPIYSNFKQITLDRLAKGKLQCILSQYPNCPVISPLCYNLLSKFDHVKKIKIPHGMSNFERVDYISRCNTPARRPNVKTRTRLLVEELYNIPLSYQKDIEAKGLGSDNLFDLTTAQSRDYFIRFVMTLSEFQTVAVTEPLPPIRGGGTSVCFH